MTFEGRGGEGRNDWVTFVRRVNVWESLLSIALSRPLSLPQLCPSRSTCLYSEFVNQRQAGRQAQSSQEKGRAENKGRGGEGSQV